MILSTFLEKLDQQLAIILNTGTDEELALASYLQGHIDVVSAQFDVRESVMNEMVTAIDKSLLRAFEQGELEHEDQIVALAIWQKLKDLSYL